MRCPFSTLISASVMFLAVTGEAATAYTCASLLAQVIEKYGSHEDAYINLIESLVRNKNALSSADLKILVSQPRIVNPFEIISPSLPPEQAFAYRSAFDKVLIQRETSILDWEKIKTVIADLASNKTGIDRNREKAKSITAEVFIPKPLVAIKNVPAKPPYGSGYSEYITDQGESYVSYLSGKGDKVVLINQNTKLPEVMSVQKDAYGILTASGKQGLYFISVGKDGFKIYPTGQKTLPDLPSRSVSKKRMSNGGIAVAQRADKTVLVKVDGLFPESRVWFIPLGEPDVKTKSVEITGSLSSPRAFNFAQHSLIGLVGEEDTVYFFDPFTSDLISKKQVNGMRGHVEFYETEGEPRALVSTFDGISVLNPLTGKILNSVRFKNDPSQIKLTFFKNQGREYAVIPGDDSKAAVLDLQTNKLLKKKISLTPDWDMVLSSNIASFTFNGNPRLIWATKSKANHDAEIIIFDPVANEVIHRTAFEYIKSINFIAPYTLDGHSEAIVGVNDGFTNAWSFSNEGLPFVMQLTATASPQIEGAVE